MKRATVLIAALLAAGLMRAADMQVELQAGDTLIVTVESAPVTPPVLDTDGDGVNDDIDQCQDTPLGDEVDATGCTVVVVPPPVDTDGDGVQDDVDQCPAEPANTADGCPIVIPPPVGDLANTALGQFAITVQPGEFALLPNSSPGDLLKGHYPDGSIAPMIDEWTSSAYWHPETLRTFFMGLRIQNRFISYSAIDHAWNEIQFAGETNAPPEFPGTGHMYERIALDANRGHFYHQRDGILYRYVIATGQWEKFGVSHLTSTNQIVEWHDTLDMLVSLENGTLTGWRDGQVFQLGASPVDGYHSALRYNKIRGDMLMMGGNASLRTVALMLPDGSVEQRAAAPFDFSISTRNLTYDPVSGNYIVTTAEREIYEYSPDLNEWRMVAPAATVRADWPLDWYMHNVPIVIDELGVIAWQTPAGLVLHRHQSVFDQQAQVPPQAQSLIAEQAATMAPGEWRNIADLTDWPGKEEGVNFKSFQYVRGIEDPTAPGSADGMGWTQNLVYHNGKLALLLMRSQNQRALMVMEPDGNWWRVNQPPGFDNGGRRPFNRLTQDDEYLYFAPNDCKECMGYFIRTPLDNPGVFERYGIAIGDDQMDSVGNFAVTWVPEWGRFYAYTPGGKLWTWTHGEPAWTLLDRLRWDLSGYAGVLMWNSVKKELVVAGGQVFGDAENLGNRVARITEPIGKMELLPPMFKPDGEPMYYTAAQNKLIIDPRDGSYLQIAADKQIYRNDEVGGTYEAYGSVDKDAGWPFGAYELYAPYARVPGTDVFVFVSHIKGVVLHRLG